ncbi:MAG: GvpL/GvpF family gas vesicle protein, partial [Chloroflexota bacterium]|nr:GvpL/GvpF family gas vesicle protein [Chloroflexota bacterium]
DQEIKTKPRGLAYMYRQRLEGLLRKEMEAKAEQSFRDFYSRIRRHAADVVAEKTKQPEKGGQMILNLSCLVDRERYIELGEELDRINQQKGFWVRYTGPWPPYSFVGSAG